MIAVVLHLTVRDIVHHRLVLVRMNEHFASEGNKMQRRTPSRPAPRLAVSTLLLSWCWLQFIFNGFWRRFLHSRRFSACDGSFLDSRSFASSKRWCFQPAVQELVRAPQQVATLAHRCGRLLDTLKVASEEASWGGFQSRISQRATWAVSPAES